MTLKKILQILKAIGIILLLAGAVIGITYAQFKVYQKKYGDHMTFMDWWIDPETSR